MDDVTPESMVILGPRRRGRPRVDEPCVPVTSWIPASAYDDLAKQAKRQDMSLSRLVRDRIVPTKRR